MDAKSAAAKIEAGLHTLSDKELIEVYLALKGDDKYADQFAKLSAHASSKLEAFAANRKAGMSFEEAIEYHRFVSVFGRENGKYTETGKKAQEALFASIREIKLTPAQKLALDEHGFMYNETIGSAFDRKNVAEVMRVLESAAPEKNVSRLTEKQKQVLDAHGYMYSNDDPNSLKNYQHEDAARKVLSDEGAPLTNEQLPQKKKASKGAASENKDDQNKADKNEESIFDSEKEEKSNAQVNRNFTILDGFYNSVNPLDENDKDFEETRKYLNNMEVVDEEGNVIDVRQEIIDLAKLKTEAELHTADHNTITPEVYKSTLKDNIDQTVYTMLMTEGLVKNGVQGQSPDQLRKQIDEILKGGKKQISRNTASGVLGVKSQEMHSFSDRLAARFKGLPFVSKFKQKLKKVDENLTRKLGKPYVKARTYAEMLAKSGAGYDLAMAAVAGFGGPVGLAAYGAYTFVRRSVPFYKAYKEEVKANKEKKGFWNYVKNHKKDATIAALYTASSILSLGTAGLIAASNVAQAAGAVQTFSNLDTATRYLSTSKAGVAAGTVATRGVTDIYEARKNNGDVNGAVKRTLFSLGLFGLGYAARELMSGDHVPSSSKEPTVAPTTTPTAAPMLDENHNGIPDYIERPVDAPAGNGIHVPWQDGSTEHTTASVESGHEAIAGGHEYSIGAREQSVYERNLVYVHNSDIMVDNVKEGLVTLPKGMTPEMAVNLARVEQLYYGNDTTLKILMDCDEIKGVHFTEEMKLAHLNKVAAMFTDKCSEPYGVGFPRDPNYGYVDPNIRVDLVNTGDCGDPTRLHYVGGGRTPVVQPTPPVNPTPTVPTTPTNPTIEPDRAPLLGEPVRPRIDVAPTPMPAHLDPINVPEQPATPAGDEYQPYNGSGHGSNADFNQKLEDDRVSFRDGKFVALTPEQAAAEAAAKGADAPVLGNVTENDTPLNASGDGSKALNETLSKPGLKFDPKTGKFFTSGGR